MLAVHETLTVAPNPAPDHTALFEIPDLFKFLPLQFRGEGARSRRDAAAGSALPHQRRQRQQRRTPPFLARNGPRSYKTTLQLRGMADDVYW